MDIQSIKNHKALNVLRLIKRKLISDNTNAQINNYTFDNYEQWFKSQINVDNVEHFKYKPLISIIVPAFNTPITFFEEMIDSVKLQNYKNWELCIADGSTTDDVDEYISKNYKDNLRVKYKKIWNKGIAGNTNEALSMAAGEYVAMFDHDDLLDKNTLYYYVKTLQNTDYDCLYCDEDIVSEDGRHLMGPNFKPDWSPELFNSHNYITHLFMVKKDIANAVGGFRSEYDGAQDYDFISRCIDKSSTICHIPRVLYHWRAHPNSTAGNSESKIYAYENGKKVLEDRIKNNNIDATVEMATDVLGFYHIKYKPVLNPLVSVYFKNSVKSIDTVKLKDALNYSNLEIVDDLEKAEGDYIFMLDSSLEPVKKDSFEELLGTCCRDNIGAVAGKILYNSDTVQHAGIVLDKQNFARYVFTDVQANGHGYMSRPLLDCNYSAVSTDCFMTNKKLFEDVGGFDASYKTKVKDVDLCLKIIEKGKLIAYDAHSIWNSNKLLNKNCFGDIVENKICIKNWKNYFDKGDPYYNDNFDINKDLFKL